MGLACRGEIATKERAYWRYQKAVATIGDLQYVTRQLTTRWRERHTCAPREVPRPGRTEYCCGVFEKVGVVRRVSQEPTCARRMIVLVSYRNWH